MRPEQLYLADIVAAAEAVAEFIAGLEAEDFYQDHKSQSAVLQKLIVIGKLPPVCPRILRPGILRLNGAILSPFVTFWSMPTFRFSWKLSGKPPLRMYRNCIGKFLKS